MTTKFKHTWPQRETNSSKQNIAKIKNIKDQNWSCENKSFQQEKQSRQTFHNYCISTITLCVCVWSLRLCVLLFFIWHYHETAKEMSSGSECVTSLQSDLSCWHTESRADSAERDSLSSGGVRRFFFLCLWGVPLSSPSCLTLLLSYLYPTYILCFLLLSWVLLCTQRETKWTQTEKKKYT